MSEVYQKFSTVKHLMVDGVVYHRTRYGDEAIDWGADTHLCHDCGVAKGEFHISRCELERCPFCQGQLISCEH